MSRDEVFEKMLELLRQQLGDPQLDITPESSLHDDLAIDSIALTEFIINLEDVFHLEISDGAVEHMSSVQQLLDYIIEHK
ncbi:acyl carrier protein [Streptococcus agalactiae BSU260]|uniref:phosphopantetheine-binding protein n=1 Tax=Streptococcus agalactiae TaxID=1311 RepID=UPI0002FAC5B1|nr:phosphopantetheine-binding protein [Streptococcus agalactiae]EPW69581.1 acyl carrier protein [Streptococcus agalactiae BSU260]